MSLFHTTHLLVVLVVVDVAAAIPMLLDVAMALLMCDEAGRHGMSIPAREHIKEISRNRCRGSDDGIFETFTASFKHIGSGTKYTYSLGNATRSFVTVTVANLGTC
ncbi:hypothetical protein B0H13DRAFT_2359551 [Mycena leptocephala]|nr:hypothetical protein B0H13DRAFT_2359551 [Mycena leptocephala]